MHAHEYTLVAGRLQPFVANADIPTAGPYLDWPMSCCLSCQSAAAYQEHRGTNLISIKDRRLAARHN
jgi:hypothetical protein